MSVVQALAAMLSAGADANSRVQAAGLAANASLRNSANALKGDMYRANVQSQLGQQGIAADMQRSAGEQALRAMLGQAQLRMEGQRNNLTGQQLGLDRQRIASDRDLKLAELGLGPYAPKVPDMSDLAGGGQPAVPAAAPEQQYGLLDRLLGRRPVPGSAPAAAAQGGQRVDPAQEMIKRMFLANPNNPRMQAMMSDLLGRQQRDAQWQQEFDFKKNALSDPNALFAALAPDVLGMNGVTPDNAVDFLEKFRSQLGGRGAAASTPTAAPTFPSLAAASAEMGKTDNVELLKTLGLGARPNAYDAGIAIEGRLPSLTGTDLATLQKTLAAVSQTDPTFFSKVPGSAQVAMIKALLGSNPQELTAELLRQRLGAATKSNAAVSGGYGGDNFGGFGSY